MTPRRTNRSRLAVQPPPPDPLYHWDGLEALYRAEHERLRTLARRLFADADDAEDAVHEVFLATARAAVPGRQVRRGYLYRALVNYSRRFSRRATRAARLFDLAVALHSADHGEARLEADHGGDDGPGDELTGARSAHTITLSPARNAVIELWLRGWSYDRIAQERGVKPNTVNAQVQQAVHDIAKQLGRPVRTVTERLRRARRLFGEARRTAEREREREEREKGKEE